jgi:hypothetical protein
LITHIQIHGRTPLDEWSARRRDLYLHRTTQRIKTTDKHPCPERDSNPRSQQPSGLRQSGLWDRMIHLINQTNFNGVPNSMRMHNTSLETETQVFLKLINTWFTATLYFHFFLSTWWMQNILSIVIDYVGIHLDDMQWFSLLTDFTMKRECGMKFCMQLIIVIGLLLANYLSQFYHPCYK